MNKGGIKWGLVTFAAGITCGVIGRVTPNVADATGAVLVLAMVFAAIGAFVID